MEIDNLSVKQKEELRYEYHKLAGELQCKIRQLYEHRPPYYEAPKLSNDDKILEAKWNEELNNLFLKYSPIL